MSLAARTGSLSERQAQPGRRPPDRRTDITPLRLLRPSRGRRPHQHWLGPAMACNLVGRGVIDTGGARQDGAPLCAMAERPRSGSRGAPTRAAAGPLSACSPLYLQRGRDRRDRRCRRPAVDLWDARPDLLDAVRPYRSDGAADQRSAAPRSRRSGCRARRAVRPLREARQGTAAPARSERGHSPRSLWRRARSAARPCIQRDVRHLRGREARRLWRTL